MSRDIYPALTGAAAVWEQLNQVSQNLANVNTTGYKALRVPFENHMATEGILGDSFVKLGEEELDCELVELRVDHREHSLELGKPAAEVLAATVPKLLRMKFGAHVRWVGRCGADQGQVF